MSHVPHQPPTPEDAIKTHGPEASALADRIGTLFAETFGHAPEHVRALVLVVVANELGQYVNDPKLLALCGATIERNLLRRMARLVDPTLSH